MSGQNIKIDQFNLHLKNFDFTMGQSNSQIISGGDDYTIKFFDLEKKDNQRTLDSEDEINLLFYVREKNLLIFAYEAELKLKELSSDTKDISDAVSLTKFNTFVKGIYYYSELNLIFAFSDDEDIHIIDVDTYEINKKKSNHEGSIKHLLLINGLLITTGYDGFLIINKILNRNIQYLSKIRILNNKLRDNDLQKLTIDIYEMKYLFISGNFMLRKIKIDNEENLLNPQIEMETGLCHNDDIIFLKIFHKTMLMTIDKTGIMKISNLKDLDLIENLYSINILNEIGSDNFLSFNKFLILENEKNGNFDKVWLCFGLSNGVLFFCQLAKIEDKFNNLKQKENFMEICEDINSLENNENKDHKTQKVKKQKDKKKKERKPKSNRQERSSFLDDEASLVDNESYEIESGNINSDDLKDGFGNKLNSKMEKGKEDLMDISELEDENGDFKSPEEIEKSILIFLIKKNFLM